MKNRLMITVLALMALAMTTAAQTVKPAYPAPAITPVPAHPAPAYPAPAITPVPAHPAPAITPVPAQPALGQDLSELERTKIENLQLKYTLLKAQEQELQNQYNALVMGIEKEHPEYVWNPTTGALMKKPAAAVPRQ